MKFGVQDTEGAESDISDEDIIIEDITEKSVKFKVIFSDPARISMGD